MSSNQRGSVAGFVTQVDISPNSNDSSSSDSMPAAEEQSALLRAILANMERQNKLLEEMVTQQVATQRQRNVELENWRRANPTLSKKCRQAAELLGRVQAEYLEILADEVDETGDGLMAGEFLLAEFIDRFGPRLAHLNGVLQVLSQLGTTPSQNNSHS